MELKKFRRLDGVHLDQTRNVNLAMFVDQQIDENPKFRLESNNSERRLIEFDFLFEFCVRRMIRTQDRQSAIGNSLEDCIDIRLRAQRRIHFVIRIEILDRFVGESDVMRTNFATDFHASRARFADQADAPGRADVLTVNVMITKFGEQNVPHYDCFFAGRRPAGQTEQRAPITLVHDSAANQIVILAVIKDWKTNHARVLNCAPHQFVVLNTMTIIGNRDHAGLA